MEQDRRDPQEIFENRFKKFKQLIQESKTKALKNIKEQEEQQIQNEVAKIKNQAKTSDQDVYKKIEDNIKVTEKIYKSRKTNESRMSEMKLRFDMVQKIQQQTKNALRHKLDNKSEYKKLLENLIIQGLIKLLEEKVQVRCLKKDESLVNEILTQCEKKFGQMCVVQSHIKVDTRNYLNDKDIGGVILTSFGGRIVCDNTFRARLDYCLQLLLPNIRKILFSESDLYLAEKKKIEK